MKQEIIYKFKYFYKRKLWFDKSGYTYVVSDNANCFTDVIAKIYMMNVIPQNVNEFWIFLIGKSKDYHRLKNKPDGDLPKKRKMKIIQIFQRLNYKTK